MAWSYDPTNLDTTTASGRLDSVRLLVGDTNALDQQAQNEEIGFALSQNNNGIYYAASWLARTIAAQYARRVSTELSGALKAEYSDLMSHYTTLGDQLQYEAKTSGAAIGVLAGGITIARVNAVRANTNRLPPAFRIDQFKNPPSYKTPDYS